LIYREIEEICPPQLPLTAPREPRTRSAAGPQGRAGQRNDGYIRPPSTSAGAEHSVSKQKRKTLYRYFPPVHTFHNPIRLRHLHGPYAQTNRDLFTPDERNSKTKTKENMPHDGLISAKTQDIYPYASPEGDIRTPPRGGEWRMQNGTLGAAMRLKALSHAPPEITEHPKYINQKRTEQKPEQTDPLSYNPLPKCNGTAPPPHTGVVREKLEGPQRALRTSRTCLNPATSSPI
jgi:hypothetical protein